jgi:hypothetical protein
MSVGSDQRLDFALVVSGSSSDTLVLLAQAISPSNSVKVSKYRMSSWLVLLL